MTTLESHFASTLSTVRRAQTKLVPPTAALQTAITNSAASGLPRIAIGPAHGQLLCTLCKLVDARRILEIGTLGGYSTIWLASSSERARVVSLEVDEKHARVAGENTAFLVSGDDDDDDRRVEIRLGDALELLPKLAEEQQEQQGEKFDFVFVDADWDHQREYFDWAVRLTRSGGLVYVDNAVRQLIYEEGQGGQAESLVDYVAADERVEPTLLATMNTEKDGWRDGAVDGFVLARVK